MLFNKIRDLSQKQGLSINQLEAKAELAKNTVYTWKRRDPSAKKVLQVAKALGTTVEELMEVE